MKDLKLHGKLNTRCGAVGKLSPPTGEKPGASVAGVRNPLKALCGQGQAETEQRLISPFKYGDTL